MNDLTIYDHLSFLQKNVKAPKSEANPFQRWNYRTVDGILEAVKALKPEGCYILMSDEPELIGEFHYIKSTVTFGYKDKQITVTARAREPAEERNKSGALSKLPQQVTASSSTFARKMALCGMFAVDNSDVVQDTTVADGDIQNQEDLYDYRNAQQKASPTINDDLALIISGLVSKAQMPIGKFLSKYNIGYINQLPQNKYDEAVKSLNDYMDKKREKDNQQFDQTDYLRA